MLNWLKKDKVDHPLFDAKQAKAVIDQFPTNDPWQMLEDANFWLDSVNTTEDFKLEKRFELVSQLDDATRRARRTLFTTYRGLGEGDKIQEKRIAKTMTEFWRLLGAGYLACAGQAREAGNVSAAFKASLPLIAVRGMRALREQLKWVLMRYGLARPEFWPEVAQLWTFAEAGGFDNNELEIYSGWGQTSVRGEALRVMVLWASSPDGLSPLEQDVLERLVEHLTPKFRFSLKSSGGGEHCFDLGGAHPPQRLTPATPVTENTRYFDVVEAHLAVQAMLTLVKDTGNAPTGIEWGEGAGIVTGAKVLKHLQTQWAKQVPTRASARRKTAMTLQIVHGFQNVQNAVVPDMNDGLDFSEALAYDTWIAEDASTGGFGTIVPAGKGDWLKVGVLLAVRTETETSWSVGAIRRLSSDEHRQFHVGIQLIARAARLVNVRTAVTAQQGGKHQSALMLGTGPSPSGSLHVIARSEALDGKTAVEAIYGDPPCAINLEPAGVLEMGVDFDWLRFKVSQATF